MGRVVFALFLALSLGGMIAGMAMLSSPEEPDWRAEIESSRWFGPADSGETIDADYGIRGVILVPEETQLLPACDVRGEHSVRSGRLREPTARVGSGGRRARLSSPDLDDLVGIEHDGRSWRWAYTIPVDDLNRVTCDTEFAVTKRPGDPGDWTATWLMVGSIASLIIGVGVSARLWGRARTSGNTRSWAANRSEGKIAHGGRLVLTPDRIRFEAHAFNTPQSYAFDVALTELASVGVQPRGGDSFAGGLRKRLRLQLADGRTELFLVNGLAGVVRAIEAARLAAVGGMPPQAGGPVTPPR